MKPLPPELEIVVLLKVGDNVSTDEILPAGARVLPYRSNIPAIADYAFDMIDDTYPERAKAVREAGGHVVVAGNNYGQGSSREHAALAPRFLGLRVVVARSFARIHWHNLVNFGILPLTFADPATHGQIEQGDRLRFSGLQSLRPGQVLSVENVTRGRSIEARHALSPRQIAVMKAGTLIAWVRQRL
jgi:aconitate hydratase